MFGQYNGLHQFISLLAFTIAVCGILFSSSTLIWVVSLIVLLFSVVWFLLIGHGLYYLFPLIELFRELISLNRDNR